MDDSTHCTRRAFVRAGMAAGMALALPRTAAAATTLRWATVLPANHPMVAMMNRVADEMRAKTGGGVEIQTFPAGQLGSSRDLIEAASGGAIQIVDEGAAQFGQFVPKFSILEAPYIWRDAAHVRRVLASPIVDDMNAELVAKRAMRVVGSTYYGKRHITSGARPLHSAADMQGFKLRIPEVDTFRAMAEAWGARATPLNIGELYLALSQGAVDGQENPLPTIQSNKFYEVQKHLVLTGHVITPRLVVVNETAWQALGAQNQALLRAAIDAAGRAQDDDILRQEANLVGTFKAAGMNVIEPDVESFRNPVLAALPPKFESKWGKGLWERIAAA
jgi:TRAP-type transport system periplasmic protein